ATRGLFWDGPRHFGPRSDGEDDTRADTPSPNFRTTSEGGYLATTYDLTATGPIHGGSSVESGFEPGSLRLELLPLVVQPYAAICCRSAAIVLELFDALVRLVRIFPIK
ncbi:hypothetical protein AVEN_149995-1, partial [Araneus ventricosus]